MSEKKKRGKKKVLLPKAPCHLSLNISVNTVKDAAPSLVKFRVANFHQSAHVKIAGPSFRAVHSGYNSTEKLRHFACPSRRIGIPRDIDYSAIGTRRKICSNPNINGTADTRQGSGVSLFLKTLINMNIKR